MAPLASRNDLLKLLDQEGAWLEFLEQTKWFDNPTGNVQIIVGRALYMLKLADAQRLAREVLSRLVPTADLGNTIQDVWEEYPTWWTRKYGN